MRHDQFVDKVNEAISRLRFNSPEEVGEVHILVPTPINFKPSKKDISEINLKNAKCEMVKEGRLFDKHGNCIFDVQETSYAICRIIGEVTQ